MTTRQSRLQNKLRRILNLDELTFVLGDGSGRVFAGNGRVFVRQRIGLDVSGAPSFSTAITAKHQAGATYPVYGGSPVKLAYDKAGDLQVVGADFQAIVATGVDPALLNTGNPYTRQERIFNYAKPHVEPDTNTLGATQLLYRKPDGSLAFFDPSVSTFIDPSGDLPASGNHRLLGMYINVTSNALERTLGTAKPLAQAFTVGDVNEVVAAMPDDAIPIAAWVLRGGQTAWRNSDVFIDLRQFINTASGGGTEFDVTDTTNTETVTDVLSFNASDFEITDVGGTPTVNFVGSAAAALEVTDTVTSVDPVSSIEFDGATVTDEGAGVAKVTITGGGGGVKVTKGATEVDPTTEIQIGDNLTLSDEGAGVAKIDATGGGGAIAYPRHAFMLHGQARVLAGGSTLEYFTSGGQEMRGLRQQAPREIGDKIGHWMVLEAGIYDFVVTGATSSNRGIIEWAINGDDFGTQDWRTGSSVRTIEDVEVPTSGLHELTCETIGTSGSDVAVALNSYYFIWKSVLP